jgi:hypothetical protein
VFRLGRLTPVRGPGLAVLIRCGPEIGGGQSSTIVFPLPLDLDVLRAKLALLVLVGVLIGLHVVEPASRVLSVALFLASLGVVWLGVELTH